jgi:hypothetical protein
VIVAFVFALEAQAKPVSKVEIGIDNQCRIPLPDRIRVVLTVGKQTVAFTAKLDNADGLWKGDYPVDEQHPIVKTFQTDHAMASLRLDGFRTYCQTPIASENKEKEDVARFSFVCSELPARSVEVETDGPIKVDYRRKFKGCPKDGELESFETSVSFPIPKLLVPGEEFRLLFNWDKPNPLDPGLLLFSVDANEKDLPVFWLDSKRIMYRDEYDHPHELKGGASLPLPLDHIVNILAKQRSAINGDNSKSGRINDELRLRGKLKTLTLAVN